VTRGERGAALPPAAAAAARRGLAPGLDELRCEALLVLAQSAAEPDLAPFLGTSPSGTLGTVGTPVNVGQALLVVPREGGARLAYLTPMEREEAAATGLALLTPEQLEVTRHQQEAAGPAAFFAAWIGAALAASGVEPGRVALAGRGPAGLVQAACALLAGAGWSWADGGGLVAALRKTKNARELAAIQQAAAGTADALRAVAALLAAATPGAAAGPPASAISGVPAGPAASSSPGAPADSLTSATPGAAAGPLASAAPRGAELHLEGAPLTVARLRAEVGRVLGERGLEQPFGAILAPAEQGAVPHTAGHPERVLRAGESLVVDLFPRGGMFADCTRTFCVGPPPEALVRAHAAVLAALRQARAAALPGARGWDLQEAVCRTFQDLGYPTPISHPGTATGYVHNLGHGVGYELHEQPIFRKECGAEGVLAAGDVFTLEPGLYDPAAGYGVRLEDLHHLGEEGLEVLTDLPYDLDPRAWE
jgi:Xaa-Pro aminopeptidase